MSKCRPLVSINCITFNHAPFIRLALDGFVMQKTNFVYEVVVHDDASTDGTADIIREYEKKYPHLIKPIYEVENQWSKGNMSRRCVYPHLRGKYTAFCEGDDYWTDPYKLQKQVDYLESHPDCSFTFHNADVVWVNNRKKCTLLPDKSLKSHVWRNQNMELDCGQIIDLGFIPTASIVVRTDLLVNRPDFCEKPICGDMPMRLYFSSVGYAYYFNEIMSVYRIGNSNSAVGRASVSVKNMERTLAGHIDILNGFNKYTNYKWNQNIENEIKRLKLSFYLNTSNMEALKAEEYRYLYKYELTMFGKLKFFMKTHMNGVFVFIKNYLNGT